MPTLYSTGARLGASWAGSPFGPVGYRIVTFGGSAVAAFTATGVTETSIPGQYTVTGGVLIPDGFTGRIVWGTVSTDRAEEFFGGVRYVPSAYQTGSRLGHTHSGLAVGYRVVDSSGTVITAFTLAGVTEDTVPGDYLAAVTLPDAFTGRIVWGPSGSDIAQEWVNSSAGATPPVTPTGGVTLNRSRFRVGDTAVVTLSAVEPPASAPVALLRDVFGATQATYYLPVSSPPDLFSLPFRVPAGLALGTFSVLVTYLGSRTGTTYSGSAGFTLVPGGDSGGLVIAMFGSSLPGGHLIVQLNSGVVVQGSNPKI